MSEPMVDGAMVSDKGGVIEVAMVVDGQIVVFDMTRQVAAELASTIVKTLSMPYFIELTVSTPVKVRKLHTA